MDNWHIVDHVRNKHLIHDDTLHVIGVISNPVQFHSRYRIGRSWMKAMAETPGVRLTVVETAFADRYHEMECDKSFDLIQMRTGSEAWIKESMINVGVRHAIHKHNAKYIAWVDMDVYFRDQDWALKAVQELQHFKVIQPWSDALDLGPKGSVLEHHKSFGYLNTHDIRRQRNPNEPYKFGHPGFAWATTRAFWENTRGLMDFAILGSGDHHMATAMVNEVDTSIHPGMHASFKRLCHEWQRRAFRECHGYVGYVPGRIEHMFHGPKKRRYYRERWQILVDHCYDPDTDLRYDEAGLTYLTGKPRLERAIRQYNRSRFEDSIEEC